MDRVEHRLMTQLARASHDFALLEPGDRVMVAVSGGKDSHALLYLLREDTYSVVVSHVPEGKTYCSMCSRLRRGVLYSAASELACTKIALGHHRDDAVETLLMNLIYTGALASMPPKLTSRDGQHVVIRPLLYAHEQVIARYAELMGFPILPCDLCGSQEQLKRKQVKRLLTELERIAPQARESMLAAMGNVKTAHLLDRTLYALAPPGTSAAPANTSERSEPRVGWGPDEFTSAGRGGASLPDTEQPAKHRLPLVR